MPGSSEVERGPVKAKVAGSIPAPAATPRPRRKPGEGYVPIVPLDAGKLVKNRKTGKLQWKYPGYRPFAETLKRTLPPEEDHQVHGPEGPRWAKDFLRRADDAGVGIGAATRYRLARIRRGKPLSIREYRKCEDYLAAAIQKKALAARPHRVVLPGVLGGTPTLARNAGNAGGR